MDYRQLGRSGLRVSSLTLGTMTFGGRDKFAQVGATDLEGATRQIDMCLDAGVNLIDTADVYSGGLSEEIVGRALRGRRDRVLLATKARMPMGDGPNDAGLSRHHLIRSCEASLRRMGTDYVDLYQLHNCRIDAVRDDALWETLDALVAEGKIRALGVALGPAIGWVEEGLESIRDRDICSLQTVFNVLEQEPGLTFAREPKVADGTVSLMSRVPHASDTLSTKITPDTVFPPGDHRAHRNRENMLDNFDKADTLAFLWQGTGRTVGQAAIAGILANPAFTTVLPTCVNVEDVREYSAASDMPLTADEIAHLDELWDDNFGVTNRYEMPLKSSV